MAQMSIWDKIKMVTGMGKSGMFSPGGMLPKQKIGTGHRKTAKDGAGRTQEEKEEAVNGKFRAPMVWRWKLFIQFQFGMDYPAVAP